MTLRYSLDVTNRFLLTLALLGGLSPVRAQAQRIRPGDHLVVRLLGEEKPVADTLLVDPSGAVVLPKLGATSLTGFDLPTLPDSLRARYARYLRNPTVDVLVLRRVIVSGEVKKPDIYYVDLNATLADVVAHAGGLTEYANGKLSLRRGNSVTPVAHWETGQAAVSQLESGDQVVLGRRSWLMQNILPAISTLALLASVVITLRR